MRRVVDLSLTIDNSMSGVEILPNRSLDGDGWNATTLSLYSHSGTHMDAPRHFLPLGETIDQQDLSVCVGPARVINLVPIKPAQLIKIEHLGNAATEIKAGDRLLLRTDWYLQYGKPEYRDQLPRISVDLARWFVEQGVALIGVEPPSVADVNNLPELTEVHQILLSGKVLIVEGLAGLDQLTSEIVEFIALPLNVNGGDGCPTRAIAIEEVDDD